MELRTLLNIEKKKSSRILHTPECLELGDYIYMRQVYMRQDRAIFLNV